MTSPSRQPFQRSAAFLLCCAAFACTANPDESSDEPAGREQEVPRGGASEAGSKGGAGGATAEAGDASGGTAALSGGHGGASNGNTGGGGQTADAGRPTEIDGAAMPSGCKPPPTQGLLLWLRADADVVVGADMRVQSWTDQAMRSRKAIVPEQPALAHDPSARGPFAPPTAPRLTMSNTHTVIRFDGGRDELSLEGAPRVAGLKALSFVQVAATAKLTKPNREWCQDGLGDPIIENGCSGTYWTAILWPSWGVPGYSGAMFSLMQESVTAMFGTGSRDQKFFWIRPQSAGTRLTSAVAVHDGTRNSFFVDGKMVHEYPSQDGKDTIVNSGPRIQFGVGRFDRHWTGDLAEFLIYGHAVTNAERQVIDDYLRCKYFD